MKHSGFNPKARWDRNIPKETDQPEEPALLNEPIDVLTLFKGARIFPRMFSWNGKEYRIKKITYSWQERLGSQIVTYFSVDTGANLYQISFNNTTFGWRLDKVIE